MIKRIGEMEEGDVFRYPFGRFMLLSMTRVEQRTDNEEGIERRGKEESERSTRPDHNKHRGCSQYSGSSLFHAESK
jgi:hypothetical protein